MRRHGSAWTPTTVHQQVVYACSAGRWNSKRSLWVGAACRPLSRTLLQLTVTCLRTASSAHAKPGARPANETKTDGGDGTSRTHGQIFSARRLGVTIDAVRHRGAASSSFVQQIYAHTRGSCGSSPGRQSTPFQPVACDHLVHECDLFSAAPQLLLYRCWRSIAGRDVFVCGWVRSLPTVRCL
jgi:hypothetical protein